MSLALIVVLPFLGALFPGFLIRKGRNACALGAGAFTGGAFLLLLSYAPAVLRSQVSETLIPWLPALGLNVHFMLDGLGFLFAGLILGIGLLVILYARFYLSARDPMGQFYTYLLLFQGAMLGIVLSGNILLILIFWELTSLSSFLLIGYWKHTAAGRQGARMALTVTGAGGLAMIAGMLILGHIVGSFDIGVIVQNKELIQQSPYYLPALLLILAGCFTKSAQFPFHFWLPHAMAAPTPVSSYLHSATMVKAGLFLLARFWPVLSGTPEWFYIVSTTGIVTMVFAAKVAFFKDDIKAILAYSTVSHLGLVTMLLGFGTKIAAIVAIFHIINHATFKAALFMGAGIVDHAVHTRDMKRLGGLRRLMPITFALMTIAGLSMAGIPILNGFLSKEMMLEAAAHTTFAGVAWLVPTFAVVGALLSVAYSFRLISGIFLGPERDDYPHKPHDPSFGLWAAPGVLVVLVITIGFFPMTMVGWLVDVATSAVTQSTIHAHILHWHGFASPALWMSAVAIVGGAVFLRLQGTFRFWWDNTPKLEAKQMFDGAMTQLKNSARRFNARLHNGAFSTAMAVGVTAIIAAAGYGFLSGSHTPGTRDLMPVSLVPAVGWAALMLACLVLVRGHRDRLLSLVLVGAVGLMVSAGFVYLSAPDLALTQISVEVATVVLMLLALNFLPKHSPIESRAPRRLRDAVVAGAAGLGVTALSYAMMVRNSAFESISSFHIAEAKPSGGGTNIVNVILVDFRGYDTFGEITVLGIAALVIYALVSSLLDGGRANERLLTWTPDQARAGDRHPMMLVVATRLLLPIALIVGVFIFLRGHNMPGGGFIAGLIVSIALVMQYMASGFAWAEERQRFNYHVLVVAGVLIAATTGVGAWLFGRPFLSSTYTYVYPPVVEKFELASAALFDLGVFLAVLGAVMLSLSSLSRIALRAGESVNRRPFDVHFHEGPSTPHADGHRADGPHTGRVQGEH